MNNAQGKTDIPLTVFSGAVTELNPSDLPEGASPFNQDCDFPPGSVQTRGGRVSQYYYQNLFSQQNTGFGQSVPGAFAPDEEAWNSPAHITLNTPGTYAAVSLNVTPGGPGGTTFLDKILTNTGTSSDPITVSGTPSGVGEAAIAIVSSNQPGPGNTLLTPGAGWSAVGTGSVTSNASSIFSQALSGVSTINVSESQQSVANWCAALLFCGSSTGTAPTGIQRRSGPSGALSGPASFPFAFTNPNTAGNAILVTLTSFGSVFVPITNASVTDSNGNTYTQIANLQAGTTTLVIFMASNIAAGSNTITFTLTTGSVNDAGIAAFEIGNLGSVTPTPPHSEVLKASNFPFSIPSTQEVLGLQVIVGGNQTATSVDATLTATLEDSAGNISDPFTFQLANSDGLVTVATPLSTWGFPLTPDLLNDPNFSVRIVATASGSELATFSIYTIKIKAWLSPDPPVNFNWIKTYQQTDGAIDTLALDASGILWDESVLTNEGALNSIFTAIEPNTFAKSVTFDDVEYIALSDLHQGTDMPRLWNGEWLDRISQVGPGAPPSVAAVSSGSDIVNITQNAAQSIPTSSGGTSGSWLLWSASPSDIGDFGLPATPGNVLTWIFPKAYTAPSYIVVGANVVLTGMQTMNGVNLNNGAGSNPSFYTITSVGQPDPNNDYYDGFTVTVQQTGFFNHRAQAGTQFQATIATLTTTEQVPYLEVGNTMTVEGNSQPDYNNSWTVLQTPNASQLSITNTSLTNNIATYNFSVISGATPAVGQFVTVTGTLNGGGIFNVVNAVINTVAGSTFTILITSPDISGAAESGNGIISGTIFLFDPAGVVANPIIGTGTGGTVGTSGVLGVGTRQCVCIFQTRNGALTAPSPFVQFNITEDQNSIVVSSIPIGPPNVTARILAFTGANGANFFYIPVPVTVTSNGQQVTYSSTVVNDNTTTQATLSFPDAVLLAGIAIDVQGNNLFEQEELGSSLGTISYSSRLFAWGEQNKIQNMLNLSFDGGIGVQGATQQNPNPIVTTYPLGWTVDPVNGAGGSVIVSPQFGNAYYVKNATGSTQATYGMIYQSAFQDQYKVPIVTTNTPYSVRVSAACPSGVSSGSLVMDLFSPKLNQVYGSFTIPLSSMSTTFTIFSGTLLTTAFSQVPNDLLFRIYLTAVPNGGDVELDRVEPFPTLEPVFSTQLRASYVDNPEAFDLVTGATGPNQNQQPILGAFTLFDSLYALKQSSMFSTTDSGVTEPDLWNWREVSNRVGTIGINSYDYGEDWLVTANRAGVYFFNGGATIKMSQEIQTVWDLINWTYGHTIWLRNDQVNRRICIGIPITTPNKYMPEMPESANPTSPNVVLAMNYRELNTGLQMAEQGPVKSSFSGRLLTPEPSRKWSFWNIKAPYADFVLRNNETAPLFYCNGYADSKIFALDDDTFSDDGAPINSFYITSPFVKSDVGQQTPIGLHRSLLSYFCPLVTGEGNLLMNIYPNSTSTSVPFGVTPIALDLVSEGDLEVPANITGQRFFLRFGTNAVDEHFQLSHIVATMSADPWAPIRGTAKGRGA